MEKSNSVIKVMAVCLPLLMSSCATKKVASVDGGGAKPNSESQVGLNQKNESLQKKTFVQMVNDNQVYTKNITGNMSLTIQTGSKEISVNGSLKMRKNEVIRLQLNAPFLGFEIGRLEFAPDYVLLLDRYHKEYIKASYDQVDFLKKQGISFYTLQALFWNQLILPGTKNISASDLNKFDVGLGVNDSRLPVTYQNGNMSYTWLADKATGRIEQANIEYKSGQHGTSKLNLKYDDFKSVGVKMFPAILRFTLTTQASKQVKDMKLSVEMDKIKTDRNWSVTTDIPSKYKQVSVTDILNKIMNM